MIKLYTFTILSLFLGKINFSYAQANEKYDLTNQDQNKISLTVEVVDIKQDDATIYINLFKLENKNDNWLSVTNISTLKTQPTAHTAQLQINDLLPGEYGIRIYQDINNNRQLDRTTGNLPDEPVGFSTNPNLFLGEPNPSKVLFSLTTNTHKSIKLRMRKRR